MKRLPRGIHKLSDGTDRFWVYTTRNSRPVRNIVSWPLLRKLGVPIPANTQALQPGLALAKKALVKLQGLRLTEQRDGAIASQKKVRVADLLPLIEADYTHNNFRSWDDALSRWNHHLRPSFGDLLASELTTDHQDAYIAQRLRDKAAGGTINRELSVLRRMLKLAFVAGKIQAVPPFRHLREDNIRTGFLTQREYNLLAAQATDIGIRGLLAVAYSFGFRRGECLDLRVRQVDLVNNVIELERRQCKNNEIKIVAMTSEVRNVLAACVAGKEPDDHAFSWASDGRPIRDFRETWTALFAKAGVAPKLFHDLRRSAVRNMIERGVPMRTAMQISGHRTMSVFQRYNIQSIENLKDAALKIAKGAETATTADDLAGGSAAVEGTVQ